MFKGIFQITNFCLVQVFSLNVSVHYMSFSYTFISTGKSSFLQVNLQKGLLFTLGNVFFVEHVALDFIYYNIPNISKSCHWWFISSGLVVVHWLFTSFQCLHKFKICFKSFSKVGSWCTRKTQPNND